MSEIHYRPIGVIHSPFKTMEGTPIQPAGGRGIRGTVELAAEYGEGLADLAGFSHLILIYHLHLSAGYSLSVTPFLDDRPHGLFATRAPRRPNPIGISVVRLLGVSGGRLEIEDLDIVDGSPLLDIKPYVPEFDRVTGERTGWLAGRAGRSGEAEADGRFS